MVQHPAVHLVTVADLQRLEPVEHIELGQRHAGDAGDGVRLAHHHGVEPAAAALAPGDRAEFAAALAHAVAVGAELLGRERAGADAGSIGLGDAENEADARRAGARAGRRLSGDGVRRGDERIGAVVDIQHHALRALEQHAAAVGAGIFQHAPALPGKGQDLVADRQQCREHRLRVGLVLAGGAKPDIVMRRHCLELGAQRVFAGQVAETHGAAGDLVLIGRADAAAGGADLAGAAHRLARMVHRLMQRQDQRRGVGDDQRVRADFGPLATQQGDFLDQVPWVDDHAIADDRQLAGAHDAGRQQRQLVFNPADDQRMAGVMAALKPDDDVGAAGQPVDDLALALIAPLGADHGHVCHTGS